MRLQRLLEEKMIDHEAVFVRSNGSVNAIAIRLESADVRLIRKTEPDAPEWWSIHGAGYSGIFEYSPEYIARMLDKKFREGLL